MSTVRRPRAALLLLLTACLVLSGCALAPRRTLVFWHTLEGRHERALLRLIDRWNAENTDGVFIVPERRTVLAQHAAMLALSEGGRAPDLVLAAPAQAAAYAQRDLLQVLDRFADGPEGFKSNDRADLFPFVFNAGKTPQGQLIGIPLGGAARVMLVNRTWLNERSLLEPENWETFANVCEQAALPANNQPCFGALTDEVLLQEWLLARGTRVLAGNNQLQLNAGEVVNALTPLSGYLQQNQALPAVSDAQVHDEFALGRPVFVFEWSTHLRDVAELTSARADFDWTVAPIPSVSGVPASLQRAPLLLIPKTDAERESHAWHFVYWLLAQEQTAQWSQDTDEFPARVSAINSMDADKLPPHFFEAVQRVGARTQAEPLLAVWPCVSDVLAATALELAVSPSLTQTLEGAQGAATAQLVTECPVR